MQMFNMTSKPVVTIFARYIWELIFDYDNSANSGEITHTYSFEESGSYTSTTFNETVSKEAQKLAELGLIQLEAGVSYGPVSSGVKAGHTTSKEIDTMLQETTKEQAEKTISWSTKEVREYKIGAHSRLVLYQRNFYGPGMRVQDSALRTTPAPLPQNKLVEEVPIELMLEPRTFVKGLKVVYGDQAIEAPGNRVRDWFRRSDDINHKFGGNYVWLIPETTNKVSEALTTIDLIIQSKPNNKYSDLASGASGSYRYLVPVRQNNQKLFISELTLARSKSNIRGLLTTMVWPGLPQGNSGDINSGRKGDYLYLMWQSQRAYATT